MYAHLYPGRALQAFFFLIVLILIAVVLTIGLLLLKKKIMPHQKQKELMPWEIALQSIQSLTNTPLLKEGKHAVYYSQLSDIIRQYMEKRFVIKAPEMTTEEFLFSLKKDSQLSVTQKRTLEQFLYSCDIVKFARAMPSFKESQESISLARKLVEETKPQNELALKT